MHHTCICISPKEADSGIYSPGEEADLVIYVCHHLVVTAWTGRPHRA